MPTTLCTAAASVTPRSFRSSTTTQPAGSRATANPGTESATAPSSISSASVSTRANAARYNGWSSITPARIILDLPALFHRKSAVEKSILYQKTTKGTPNLTTAEAPDPPGGSTAHE